MYTCETCNKEYSSQKSYLSHIALCEEREDIKSRSKSMIAISDIEDERSRSRSRASVASFKPSFKDVVEKLMKERTKYKNEIKKYKTDLRSLTEDHRVEFERSQEYFQEQIISLTDERDNLAEKLNLSREQIFNEKERLRIEFSKKITAEKKRLDNVYGGKNSTTISRLEKTIDNLQERLNAQMEEKERIREEYDNQINLLTDQHRNATEQNQEIIRKSKHDLDLEREEIRRSIQLLQNEKETTITLLRREKDQEIQNLIAEKDTVIKSLEFTVNNLHKDKELMKKDYDREISNLNCEHDLNLRERNTIINRLKDNHINATNQAHTKYESQLKYLSDKAVEDIEVLSKEHQKEKVIINAKHTDNINEIKANFTEKLKEIENELDFYKNKILKTENESKILIDKSNKDTEERILQIERDNKQYIDTLKRDIDRDHQENIRIRDDTINELERLNHSLGAQVGHYRSAMDNMKNDIGRIKQQFILNLNKQKEDDERAISERETRISNLESEIKKIYDSTSQQLNTAKQTIEKLQYEKVDIEIKLKSTEEINNENSRLKVIEDNLNKKIEQLQRDLQHSQNIIEDNKQQFTTQLNAITGLTNPEKEELKNIKNQLSLKNEQLSKLKTFSENLADNLASNQKTLDNTQKELNKERNEIAKERNEIAKERIEIAKERNEMSKELAKQLASKDEQLAKLKTFSENLKKKFNN